MLFRVNLSKKKIENLSGEYISFVLLKLDIIIKN